MLELKVELNTIMWQYMFRIEECLNLAIRCSINDVTLLEVPKIIIQGVMANGNQSYLRSCLCPGFLE